MWIVNAIHFYYTLNNIFITVCPCLWPVHCTSGCERKLNVSICTFQPKTLKKYILCFRMKIFILSIIINLYPPTPVGIRCCIRAFSNFLPSCPTTTSINDRLYFYYSPYCITDYRHLLCCIDQMYNTTL